MNRLLAALPLATLLLVVGVLHFVSPEPFVRIVPPWLPEPLALVYVSGVFEVLGGVGLLVPRTRRMAAWGVLALLVAVFPANVHMAVAGAQPFPEDPVPAWAAWARLPLQPVLWLWAWFLTRPDAGAASFGRGPR